MKRIISLLFALLLAVSLVSGCSQKPKEEAGTDTEVQTTDDGQTTEETTEEAPADDNAATDQAPADDSAPTDNNTESTQ